MREEIFAGCRRRCPYTISFRKAKKHCYTTHCILALSNNYCFVHLFSVSLSYTPSINECKEYVPVRDEASLLDQCQKKVRFSETSRFTTSSPKGAILVTCTDSEQLNYHATYPSEQRKPLKFDNKKATELYSSQ